MRQDITQIVHKNIRTLLEMERKFERQKTTQERMADTITRFAGSMKFVYLHAAFFGFWLVYNTGIFGLPPFDPYPYVGLAMFASVEAIFLSTFILISQNRMNELAEKRSDLDLQISLLTEHELTQLIRIVDAMAGKLGISSNLVTTNSVEELKQDVPPEVVLESIEKEKKDRPT